MMPPCVVSCTESLYAFFVRAREATCGFSVIAAMAWVV